jgi:hypothetical protein
VVVSGRRPHGRVMTVSRVAPPRRLELWDLRNGRRRSVAVDEKNGGRATRGCCPPEERKVVQRRGAQGGGLSVAQAPTALGVTVVNGGAARAPKVAGA